MDSALPTYGPAKLWALISKTDRGWINHINDAINDGLKRGIGYHRTRSEDTNVIVDLLFKLPEDTCNHLADMWQQNREEDVKTQLELTIFKLAYNNVYLTDSSTTKNQTLTATKSRQLAALQATGINPKTLTLLADTTTTNLTSAITIKHLKTLATQPLEQQLAYVWCRRNKIGAEKAYQLATEQNTKTILALPGSILQDAQLTEDILKNPIDNTTRATLAEPFMKRLYGRDDIDVGSLLAQSLLATQSINSHRLIPKLAGMHKRVQNLPDKTIEKILDHPYSKTLYTILAHPQFNRTDLETFIAWQTNTINNLPKTENTINITNILNTVAETIQQQKTNKSVTYTITKNQKKQLDTAYDYQENRIQHDTLSALKQSTNPGLTTTSLSAKTATSPNLDTLLVKQTLKLYIENLQNLQQKHPKVDVEQLKPKAWNKTTQTILSKEDPTQLWKTLILPAYTNGFDLISDKITEQLAASGRTPKNLEWWIKTGPKQTLWAENAKEIGMTPNTPITAQHLLELAENYPPGTGEEKQALTSQMGTQCANLQPDTIQEAYPHWITGLQTPELFLPWQQVFEKQNLKGYFLARTDPRGIHLGLYTNCCQHLGSVGASCAIHGTTDKNGSFFIVEDETGKILAQSWVWHIHENNQHKLVIDNIELANKGYTSGIGNDVKNIKTIYEQAAEELTKHYNTILLGSTYTLSYLLNNYPKANKNQIASTDHLKYTDADETQYILAQNTNTVAWPETANTQTNTTVENRQQYLNRTTTIIWEDKTPPTDTWCGPGQTIIDKNGKILQQNLQTSKANIGQADDENTYSWIHTHQQLAGALHTIKTLQAKLSDTFNYQLLDMLLHQVETEYGVAVKEAAKILALLHQKTSKQTIQYLIKNNLLDNLTSVQASKIATVETLEANYPGQLNETYELLKPEYNHIFGKQREEITYQIGLLKAAGLTAAELQQSIQSHSLADTAETLIWLNPDEYRAWKTAGYTFSNITEAKKSKLSLNQYKNQQTKQPKNLKVATALQLLLADFDKTGPDDYLLADKLHQTIIEMYQNHYYSSLASVRAWAKDSNATDAALQQARKDLELEEYIPLETAAIVSEQILTKNLWNKVKDLDEQTLPQLVKMTSFLKGNLGSWRYQTVETLQQHLNTLAMLEQLNLSYQSLKDKDLYYSWTTKPSVLVNVKQAYLDAGWTAEQLQNPNNILYSIADKNFYEKTDEKDRTQIGVELTDINTWGIRCIDLARQTDPQNKVENLVCDNLDTARFLLKHKISKKILKSPVSKNIKNLGPLADLFEKHDELLQRWWREQIIDDILKEKVVTKEQLIKVLKPWKDKLEERQKQYENYEKNYVVKRQKQKAAYQSR